VTSKLRQRFVYAGGRPARFQLLYSSRFGQLKRNIDMSKPYKQTNKQRNSKKEKYAMVHLKKYPNF